MDDYLAQEDLDPTLSRITAGRWSASKRLTYLQQLPDGQVEIHSAAAGSCPSLIKSSQLREVLFDRPGADAILVAGLSLFSMVLHEAKGPMKHRPTIERVAGEVAKDGAIHLFGFGEEYSVSKSIHIATGKRHCWTVISVGGFENYFLLCVSHPAGDAVARFLDPTYPEIHATAGGAKRIASSFYSYRQQHGIGGEVLIPFIIALDGNSHEAIREAYDEFFPRLGVYYDASADELDRYEAAQVAQRSRLFQPLETPWAARFLAINKLCRTRGSLTVRS